MEPKLAGRGADFFLKLEILRARVDPWSIGGVRLEEATSEREVDEGGNLTPRSRWFFSELDEVLFEIA